MPSVRILVVDDEVGMLEVCVDILGKLGDAEVVDEITVTWPNGADFAPEFLHERVRVTA